MRYDFDGSKSATIFLARFSAIIERSTIHYGRGCRSHVSMLIKSIDRKIPPACSRFHACTSQRVVRTHRHGELELCNNTKNKNLLFLCLDVEDDSAKKGEMRRQKYTKRANAFFALSF